MRCPQLDYYIGQNIKKCKPDKEGAFSVHLESGVVITSESGGTCPPGIDGFQIVMADHDADPSWIEVARIEGGEAVANQMVEFDRMNYRIADDDYPDGPHYPGRVHEGMDEFDTMRPADPSAERDKGHADPAPEPKHKHKEN